MNYLLDSNTVSDLYNRSSPQHPAISKRFAALTDEDAVYASVLTLYEMEYGYANAPEDKKPLIRQNIQDMHADLELLPLSEDAALIFGKLKKAIQDTRLLTSKNLKRHSVDLMIAANAISLRFMVVSDDGLFTELAKLDTRLRVENWLVSEKTMPGCLF